MRKIETNTLLSTLWLFVLLNIVFRDIHQLVLKSELEMLLTGTFNGVEITERLMLLGGIMVQVPIGMVLFSLLLSRHIGRPITFLAVLVTASGLLSTASTDMDDMLHLVIELAAMTSILWTTWKWTEDRHSAILVEKL